MAKKMKKRVAKRRPAKSKVGAPARKAPKKAAAKKAAPKKAAPKKAVAKKAPPKKLARPAPKAAPRPVMASKKKVELDRLIREERALERDVENETARSTMSESAEYIPEAMEDSLAAELGEASVESATSGDQADENIRDEDLIEEEGGPFVQTSGRQEFALGTDASNPEDAEPAGVPTANAPRR